MSKRKWRYTGSSAIGSGHLNQQTECQDRFTCATIETNNGEILIAGVADGAGTTSCGQIGAEIACQTFVSEISSFLKISDSIKSINEDFGKFWIDFFQKRIEQIALENENPIREYASTFIGAVVGQNEAVFFQIGDGAGVYSASGKSESYYFGIAPIDSEYVNMTDFLTDETAKDKIRYTFIEENIEDLILFSDGIYAVAVNYQTNQPHEPFLMPMIAPLRNSDSINGLNEKLGKFLSSPKINEKTDDDKTIILASRHAIPN